MLRVDSFVEVSGLVETDNYMHLVCASQVKSQIDAAIEKLKVRHLRLMLYTVSHVLLNLNTQNKY